MFVRLIIFSSFFFSKKKRKTNITIWYVSSSDMVLKVRRIKNNRNRKKKCIYDARQLGGSRFWRSSWNGAVLGCNYWIIDARCVFCCILFWIESQFSNLFTMKIRSKKKKLSNSSKYSTENGNFLVCLKLFHNCMFYFGVLTLFQSSKLFSVFWN